MKRERVSAVVDREGAAVRAPQRTPAIFCNPLAENMFFAVLTT